MSDRIITPDENPFGRNNSIVDARNGVLLDALDVVLVEEANQGPVVCLQLAGRINHQQTRSQVLYMFNADGIASIVTELLALADRAGDDFSRLVQHRITARWNDVPRRQQQNSEGGDRG